MVVYLELSLCWGPVDSVPAVGCVVDVSFHLLNVVHLIQLLLLYRFDDVQLLELLPQFCDLEHLEILLDSAEVLADVDDYVQFHELIFEVSPLLEVILCLPQCLRVPLVSLVDKHLLRL